MKAVECVLCILLWFKRLVSRLSRQYIIMRQEKVQTSLCICTNLARTMVSRNHKYDCTCMSRQKKSAYNVGPLVQVFMCMDPMSMQYEA